MIDSSEITAKDSSFAPAAEEEDEEDRNPRKLRFMMARVGVDDVDVPAAAAVFGVAVETWNPAAAAAAASLCANVREFSSPFVIQAFLRSRRPGLSEHAFIKAITAITL